MNAEHMAPKELARPIIQGFKLRAKPAGMATHNSSIPSKKTLKVDNKNSKGTIF
jgi:hypothetical protein